MDKPSETPETIYLIPDSEHGHVWCDDPAPGIGMDPAESTEYRRADAADTELAAAKARIAEQDKYIEHLRHYNFGLATESEQQQARIAALEKALERTVGQAERCLNEACCAAVEKLTELAPHMGWDPGEKSAELHMRRVRSAALLKEKD